MSSGMRKSIIREIKGSFGRYIAILAIVMLGVGLFSGLKATTPAMIATENTYLTKQNFFDFRLLSTIGFETGDVEKLKEMEEVEDAEGALSADALCSFGDGNESVYKIHSVPETINRVVVTAGRMPEREDECLLDAARYGEDALGLQLTVTDNNGEDTLEMFGNRTFTAVGIVRSPYYINFERGTSSIGDGTVTGFVYVPKEAFDCDYLTEIYVTAKQKYDVYTDEYDNYIDTLSEKMEKKTEELAMARYEELLAEGWEKIEDAQTKLDEKTAEAEEELADGWQKILDGEQEMLDGEQEIHDGEQKILDGQREIAVHEQDIRDGELEIADSEQEILDAEDEISFHEWEVFDNELKLAAARDELEQAKETLREKEESLLEQEAELLGQETELVQKETELVSQDEALAGQEAELEGQEAELAVREEELAGQEAELDSQEAGLAGQEAELNSQKEQLEQAYAMQYITQEQYEEGMGQIQQGMEQIQAGKEQLRNIRGELQAGREQIQNGKGELQAGLEQLRAGRAQLQDGLAQIRGGLEQIQAGKGEIQSGKEQIKEARDKIAYNEEVLLASEIELMAAKDEVTKARNELEDGKQELENAKVELADGREKLAKARTDLADAETELEDGRVSLEEGRVELADAKTEYADAKTEFEEEVADARQKIADARAELDDLEEPDEYVLTRNSNVGYACYESDSNIVAAIANVFPVFFFLVAALICMTTMNRMVEEQRTQIGVLKALGYGNAAIMWKYLFYAGSAAAVGAAAGCIGGTWLFPKVIWTGYSIMYSMGGIEYYFDSRTALFSLAAALLCSMGAAYFSCRYELYSVPANLIRPKAPKGGKRILLENAACLHEESVELDFGGKTKPVYMEVPEAAEEMDVFLSLHTPSGTEIPYPGRGEAVLTAKIAENMGIKAGDRVVLRDNDRNSFTVTVSALCENFVSNYIYINNETYEEQLGRKPEYKSAYVSVKEGVDVHKAAAFISDRDNVLAVSVTMDMRERIGTMMESMDYIVILIIACAGSLAFIVLYNLTNINITERIREIATIKVLGFYAKETADYVFRENLALTAIGAVAGLGLGKWLHWFVMYNVNIDMISFKTLIEPDSYLWSLVLTFVFALLVNGVMYFKLEKINMAEALKSIE